MGDPCVAFLLDDQPNENSKKVIKQLENDLNIKIVHLTDVFSFKSLITQESKYFKKANKKIAIIDGLHRFDNAACNKSAAINLFQ